MSRSHSQICNERSHPPLPTQRGTPTGCVCEEGQLRAESGGRVAILRDQKVKRKVDLGFSVVGWKARNHYSNE
eukprot:1973142-Heterocapsa_arctica.AAC.1